MALSLGVKKGSKILVGDHCVQVKNMVPPDMIVISVDDGEEVLVSDQYKSQILPDVLVFSGIGQNGGGNRLAFDAPKSIKIKRLD
ncbi:MAG: hypothetical protein WB579_00530 [Bryobacteraceae bacterium]